MLDTIGAGLNLISSASSLFGSDGRKGDREWSAWQAREQRDATLGLMREQQGFNSAEALKNRTFQQDMSNTQYQRAVADMASAGLNPMLAYHQGGSGNVSGSAASGSVGSASSAALPQNNKAAYLGASVQAATLRGQLAIQDAQAKNIQADTKLKEAQVPYTAQLQATSAADAALKNVQQSHVDATITLVGKQVRNVMQDTELKAAQAGQAEAQNRVLMETVERVKAETKNLHLTHDQIAALTAKIAVETFNMTQLSPALANEAEFAKGPYGPLKPYIDEIRRFIPFLTDRSGGGIHIYNKLPR